jgi:hypothetical protein
MKSSWNRQTALAKAAAGLAIAAILSLALWGLSAYSIYSDGDQYPGGALGVGAFLGLSGTLVAVGGLVAVCAIGFVRLTIKVIRQRGEQ